MATLDTFLPLLSCPDTKKKLQIGTDLLSYLTIEDNSLDCENISAFIDSIIHWLSNSNFKVNLVFCFFFSKNLIHSFFFLPGRSKWPRNFTTFIHTNER